jgi:TIGR03009 family protein
MRILGFALTAMLLAPAAVRAQQPSAPAAPTVDPARNRLDALLVQWEQKMKGLNTLAAECTRTTLDKTYQTKEVFIGRAKYMRPNLALLEMARQDKPDVYEKYICTGTFLYEYAPQGKTVRVHELPPPQNGQVIEDNFLSFLFGMKAEEAKRRYDLRLSKEDQHWVYIDIYPRFPADKADFQRAQLVLAQNTFMPRRLWFEQPNGNEVTWDIPRPEGNPASVQRNDFVAPPVPAGWTMTRVPRATADAGGRVQGPSEVKPRVVRPNH